MQPHVARRLGWDDDGIRAGSFAARVMSLEAKACGGRSSLRSMDLGGISASLQSIGATGYMKDQAKENLLDFQDKAKELVQQRRALQNITGGRGPAAAVSTIQLPSYFSHVSPPSSTTVHYVDYRFGGYNMVKAQEMLNESILSTCIGGGCCIGNKRFKIVRMQRLENTGLFHNSKNYESSVSVNADLLRPNTTPSVHEWLRKLGQKNGLSAAANTHYLLHGTDSQNLESIARNGLKMQYSRATGTFGQGIYFTESSCKAKQYGDGTTSGGKGCILICRVVLGNVLKLDRSVVGRRAPPSGYQSLMAEANRTQNRSSFGVQLHNEYVAFDDCACYPEFALTVDFS